MDDRVGVVVISPLSALSVSLGSQRLRIHGVCVLYMFGVFSVSQASPTGLFYLMLLCRETRVARATAEFMICADHDGQHEFARVSRRDRESNLSVSSRVRVCVDRVRACAKGRASDRLKVVYILSLRRYSIIHVFITSTTNKALLSTPPIMRVVRVRSFWEQKMVQGEIRLSPRNPKWHACKIWPTGAPPLVSLVVAGRARGRVRGQQQAKRARAAHQARAARGRLAHGAKVDDLRVVAARDARAGEARHVLAIARDEGLLVAYAVGAKVAEPQVRLSLQARQASPCARFLDIEEPSLKSQRVSGSEHFHVMREPGDRAKEEEPVLGISTLARRVRVIGHAL